jgi:hypothetical protein
VKVSDTDLLTEVSLAAMDFSSRHNDFHQLLLGFPINNKPDIGFPAKSDNPAAHETPVFVKPDYSSALVQEIKNYLFGCS